MTKHQLTFITGNPHKAMQYEKLLGIAMTHTKVDLEEIQSTDFEEVARHKIEAAYKIVQGPVMIDDFGFCINDFDNLPGPFTKFFIQSEDSLEKLCRIADIMESRRASVVTTIAYKDAERTKIFMKRLVGSVALQPRGSRGIATDYIFEPDGYDGKTRAELSEVQYDEVYLKVRPISELRAYLLSELA